MIEVLRQAEIADGLLAELSHLFAQAEILGQKRAPQRHVLGEAGDAIAHPGDKARDGGHQANYACLEVAALAIRIADLSGQQDQLPDEQDYQ